MPLQFVPKPAACAPYGSSFYFEYGYLPSIAPGITFTVIFFLIACIQMVYAIRYRAWWMLFLVIGAALDCLGWIGRIVAHYCYYSTVMNTMQVATLIMGPAWTQAGVYCTMWVLIRVLGPDVSPVSPTWYLWICFAVDTVCLTLQAIGGGLAGSAVEKNTDPQTGTNIMVIGIIAQLACGVVFFMFMSWVFARGSKSIRTERAFVLLAFAITVSTTMMILRGFYRSIELLQGWIGYLITHERFVIGLDAVPMVIAMGVLAILSPGPLLAKQRRMRHLQGDNQQITERRSVDLPNSKKSDHIVCDSGTDERGQAD